MIEIAEWGVGFGVMLPKEGGQRFLIDIERAKDLQAQETVCYAFHEKQFNYRPYRKGKNRCRFCGVKM